MEVFALEAALAAKAGQEADFRRAASTLLASLGAEALRSAQPAKAKPCSWLPSCRKRRHADSQEQLTLARLWRLLQTLPPAHRREFITRRLSQAQRVRLEQWILRERGSSRGPSTPDLPTGFSTRSLCRWQRHGRGRVGYRPILHLHASLYAQAAFTFDLTTAVRGLGMLLAMRGACQMSIGDQDSASPEQLRLAIRESLGSLACHGSHGKFYFKTRLKLGNGMELATPSCSQLDEALEDWRETRLLRATQDAMQNHAARTAFAKRCVSLQSQAKDRRRRRAKTKKPAVLLPGRFVQPRKSAGTADREPLLKSKLLV